MQKGEENPGVIVPYLCAGKMYWGLILYGIINMEMHCQWSDSLQDEH